MANRQPRPTPGPAPIEHEKDKREKKGKKRRKMKRYGRKDSTLSNDFVRDCVCGQWSKAEKGKGNCTTGRERKHALLSL